MFLLSSYPQGNFDSVSNYLISLWNYVFSQWGSIRPFGNFSLLDFFIALIVFGIIFTVVFTAVRSGVDNSMTSVDRIRNEKARAASKGKK